MKILQVAIALIAVFLLAPGCSTEDCITSDILISDYIQDSTRTFSQEPIEYVDDDGFNTGLYYIIDVPGDGVRPTAGSTVTFNYTGTTTSREPEEFDSAKDDPLTYPLSNLIQAWQLALPLIGQGGRMQLFVPANLAYGANQAGQLCPNSDIIFDITLLEVTN